LRCRLEKIKYLITNCKKEIKVMGAGKKEHKNKESDNSLCKMIKNGLLQNGPQPYKDLIANGRYYCRKCGRVAVSEKNLCKAEPL